MNNAMRKKTRGHAIGALGLALLFFTILLVACEQPPVARPPGGMERRMPELPSRVETPTIMSNEDDLTNLSTLTIRTSTEGATIHYSTDGMDPTTSSPGGRSPLRLLLSPFAAGIPHTIKAIAVKVDNITSDVATMTFTLSIGALTPPTFNLARRTVATSDRLTISSDSEGAAIHYTTNNSMPNASSPGGDSVQAVDLSPFSIGDSFTITAIAIKDGHDDSGVLSEDFTIGRDVDADNDGLIDINNLDMLDDIRHNLAGTSYSEVPLTGELRFYRGGQPGVSPTLPDNCVGTIYARIASLTHLCGYELTQDLDFEQASHYASGTVNNNWRPNNTDPDSATNKGFPGFGAETGFRSGFDGIFEGNGYTIKSLYSRNETSTGKYVGLFRYLNRGTIRNLAVSNARVYGGSGDADHVGILAGFSRLGRIAASNSSGKADGGAGNGDLVGGLVGYGQGLRLTASHSSARVSGGAGNSDAVGGLMGQSNSGGIIRASYSTAEVSSGGSSGTTGDFLGGLVGYTVFSGIIIEGSYSTGAVTGGDGNDTLGGIFGLHADSRPVTKVIRSSYSTGDLDGGGGTDSVGSLLGGGRDLTITASYGFGTVTNNDASTGPSSGSPKPNDSSGDPISDATGLSASNTGWSSTYWDFGSDSQNPAIKYNDYDGSGTLYPSCADNNGGFSSFVPGTYDPSSTSGTTLSCGSTLVGNHRP